MKPHAWHLVIGLALWFAWFCVTYGGLAVACAWSPPPASQVAWNGLNAAVLLGAVAAATGFACAAWRSARGLEQRTQGDAQTRERFIARAATALYAIAAVSTVLVALPAVVMPPCV